MFYMISKSSSFVYLTLKYKNRRNSILSVIKLVLLLLYIYERDSLHTIEKYIRTVLFSMNLCFVYISTALFFC